MRKITLLGSPQTDGSHSLGLRHAALSLAWACVGLAGVLVSPWLALPLALVFA